MEDCRKAGVTPAEGIILSGVSIRNETAVGWPSGESLKWVPKVKAGLYPVNLSGKRTV